MSARNLPHYLRSHRKRTALSQDELAWLLGCRAGSKVSRYERFARKPSIEAVFALEIVFRVPARELFRGIYEAVEQRTYRRAEALLKRLDSSSADPTTAAKLASVRAILKSSGASESNIRYA